MPELTTTQVVLLLCVGAFTLAAAVCDLRSRKIPNKMTAPMCVAGIVYQVAFFGLDGLWTALLGFAAGFGILFVLWMIATAGGGDVKLMAALGTWLGWLTTLKVLFCSLIFVTTGTIGIVLVGNFEDGSPSQAQLNSVKRLVRVLSREYDIETPQIIGHGDVKPTECPGTHFPLSEIRDSVAALAEESLR